MSDGLKQKMIEQHGAVLGPIVYDSEIKRRAEATEKFSALKLRLDAANAEFDRAGTEKAKRLVPLRSAMETAYAKWLSACNALEAQRIANEGELAPMAERISQLVAEIRGPMVHEDRIKQWGTPSWIAPEARETPPMLESTRTRGKR